LAELQVKLSKGQRVVKKAVANFMQPAPRRTRMK
jgi:hypothetical protein